MAYRPYFIEPAHLKTLGYDLVSDEDGYLKYENEPGLKCPGYGIMPKGLRTIHFNTNYCHKNEVVAMDVKTDYGNITGFHGVVATEYDLKTIVESVR